MARAVVEPRACCVLLFMLRKKEAAAIGEWRGGGDAGGWGGGGWNCAAQLLYRVRRLDRWWQAVAAEAAAVRRTRFLDREDGGGARFEALLLAQSSHTAETLCALPLHILLPPAPCPPLTSSQPAASCPRAPSGPTLAKMRETGLCRRCLTLPSRAAV